MIINNDKIYDENGECIPVYAYPRCDLWDGNKKIPAAISTNVPPWPFCPPNYRRTKIHTWSIWVCICNIYNIYLEPGDVLYFEGCLSSKTRPYFPTKTRVIIWVPGYIYLLIDAIKINEHSREKYTKVL